MYLQVKKCYQLNSRLNKRAQWVKPGQQSGLRNWGTIKGLGEIEGHLLYTPPNHKLKKHETIFLQFWTASYLILGSIREHHGVPGNLSGLRNWGTIGGLSKEECTIFTHHLATTLKQTSNHVPNISRMLAINSRQEKAQWDVPTDLSGVSNWGHIEGLLKYECTILTHHFSTSFKNTWSRVHTCLKKLATRVLVSTKEHHGHSLVNKVVWGIGVPMKS